MFMYSLEYWVQLGAIVILHLKFWVPGLLLMYEESADEKPFLENTPKIHFFCDQRKHFSLEKI